MNKEGNVALGQLQEGPGSLLKAGASKQSLGQVSGLEISCSSKQIPWLVPKPPILRAKKGAA